MTRKFKSPEMQNVYNWFRANKPAPETKGKGSAHNAYYVGATGRPNRLFQKGSASYAAWAAGADDFKNST